VINTNKLFGIFGSDDEESDRDSDSGTDRDRDRDSDTDTNTNRDRDGKSKDTEKLELRREELDINKKRIPSGEVELSKEIVEEEKTVNVPVTREEVIIERRFLNNKSTDSSIRGSETIHIPVSEEQIEVDKHTVVTEEIRARKREVEETKHIDATLKREEAHIYTTGNANVVSKADRDSE
jgi:uncharacterized protein (TIGR02271 family)